MRTHLHHRRGQVISELDTRDKRYTWAAVAGTLGTTVLLGAGGAAAMGAFDSKKDQSDEIQWKEPSFYENPEYPEAKGARQNWWSTLQDWGKSQTYGANLPNYENIFANASDKVNQLYWGGPNSPGIIDKIRAGAAQRGVSDSPGTDVLKLRAGADQANLVKDLRSGVDTAKANAVESAKNNWMNSLMALSQMKPSGTWSTGQMYQNPQEMQVSDYMPMLIGAGFDMYGSQQMGNTLDQYLSQNRNFMDKLYGGMGSTTQSSITGSPLGLKDYAAEIGSWGK